MRVHHAVTFGPSVGCYGGGMTAAEEIKVQSALKTCGRSRENSCSGGDGPTAAATCAGLDAGANAGACMNCTVEQHRVRKPRRRSGSWP